MKLQFPEWISVIGAAGGGGSGAVQVEFSQEEGKMLEKVIRLFFFPFLAAAMRAFIEQRGTWLRYI